MQVKGLFAMLQKDVVLIATLLVTLFVCSVRSAEAALPAAVLVQTGNEHHWLQDTTGNEIRRIRARYTEIKRELHTYRKIQRDLAGLSSEGGTLRAYFAKDTVRVIAATLYGETGRLDEEYYYDTAGNLFFVFRKESTYNKPFGQVAGSREDRFYFMDGKLIRWINPSGRHVPSTDPGYRVQEGQVSKFSSTLLRAVRTPKQTKGEYRV